MGYRIYCSYLLAGEYDRARLIQNAAVVVRGDTVVWIGECEKCPPDFLSDAYELVDAEGMVLIPGLVNCHGHSSLNTMRGISDAADFQSWSKELSPYTSRLGKRELEFGNILSVLEMVASGTTCICDCTRFGVGMLSSAASAVGMRSVAGGLCNSSCYRKDGDENFPAVLEGVEKAEKVWQGNPLNHFYIGAHSPYNCTPELVRRVHRVAEEKNMLFVIHAAETLDEENTVRERYGMRPVQWLDSLGVLTANTVLVHCVRLNDDDIGIIRMRGSRIVHCPVSNAKLGNGAAGVRKMAEAGIIVGLGTDSMISNNSLDMFREIKAAALAARMFHDGSGLSNEELFDMATIGGAQVLNLEKHIGSISIDKKADMVFLNLFHPMGYNLKRLLSDLVFYAGAQHVAKVMVGGKVIYSDSGFSMIDAQAVKQEIRDYFSERTTD